MAQTVEFNGFTFKINPHNRRVLLIKRSASTSFTSYINFEVTMHYLLSSKNMILIFTDNGFYNALNPFSKDWMNFKI